MTYNASSVATFGVSWATPLIIETTDTVLGNVSTDVTTAALSDSNKVFWILANNQEYLKNRESTGNKTFTLSAAATSGLNTVQAYVNTWPKEINHTYTIAIAEGALITQTSSLTCAGFFGNGAIAFVDKREATSIGTGATAAGFGSISFRDCSISNIDMRHSAVASSALLTFAATSIASLLTIDNCKSKIVINKGYFYNGETATATSRCIIIANSPDVKFAGGTAAFTVGTGGGGYTTAEIYDNSRVMFDVVLQSTSSQATNYGLHLYNNSVVTNGSTAINTFVGNVALNKIEKGGQLLFFDTITLSAWTTLLSN